jgi:hypothetical protein
MRGSQFQWSVPVGCTRTAIASQRRGAFDARIIALSGRRADADSLQRHRRRSASRWIDRLQGRGFYLLSTWCLVSGQRRDRVVATISAPRDPTNSVSTLSDMYGGQMLMGLLRGLFITSTCADLIAFHNSTARYFFCMGREGFAAGRTGCHPFRSQEPLSSVVTTDGALRDRSDGLRGRRCRSDPALLLLAATWLPPRCGC